MKSFGMWEGELVGSAGVGASKVGPRGFEFWSPATDARRVNRTERAVASVGLLLGLAPSCATPPSRGSAPTPPSSTAQAPPPSGPQASPSPERTPPPPVRAVPIELPDFFAEGLAWDASGERLLLGGIVAQAIASVDRDGGAPREFATPPGNWSVFGVAIDPSRAWVWAACAAVAQGRVLPADLGRAGVFAFSLADGSVTFEASTPADDSVDHLFGDLAVAADGTVFVTDTRGGGVFSATVGEAGLRSVVPAGTFRSIQGVVSLEPSTLVLADYSTGLVRVGLDDHGVGGEPVVIEPPTDVDLRGIDGLARSGRSLAGVQNAARPPRIVRVDLSDDATRIVAAEVVFVPEPEDGEPTLATFVAGELWVTQTDRWDRVFAEDGRPKAGVSIEAPVVLRIPWR